MGNSAEIEILLSGVEPWNAFRKEDATASANHLGPDLDGIDLSSLNLAGANLRRVSLRQAKLQGTNLAGATLGRANLSGSDLRDANLNAVSANSIVCGGTDFSGADLSNGSFIASTLRNSKFTYAKLCGAKLCDADLRFALLMTADLRGADLVQAVLSDMSLAQTDFTCAKFGGTILSRVDLSKSIGLETVHHTHYSTIGVESVYFSEGRIPETFLRGIEAPENFIEYSKSLVRQPLQFSPVLIQHSTADQTVADHLKRDLQQNGIHSGSIAFDDPTMATFQSDFDEPVRSYTTLLLIVSGNNRKAKWVAHAIKDAAQRRDMNNSRALFILAVTGLDDADWCAPLLEEHEISREYVFRDFSAGSDKANYRQAFSRLLFDLRAPLIVKPSMSWRSRFA